MTTPAGSPQQPQQSRPRDPRLPWIITGLLLLAAGVGVACFFIGKDSVDTSAKESDAAAQVRAEYQPGEPAYQAIYDKGKKAGLKEGTKKGQAAGQQQGQKVGVEQGKAQGQAEGDATGVKNGANAALGGFGGWDTNALYIVTVDTGSGNVPYTINSRQPMSANNAYRICAGSTNELCAIPLPSGSSG
jgi:hypothetical protein